MIETIYEVKGRRTDGTVGTWCATHSTLMDAAEKVSKVKLVDEGGQFSEVWVNIVQGAAPMDLTDGVWDLLYFEDAR